MPMLATENLTKRFGGLVAVSGVSMRLEEGELVGLIGPNGAGKTTVFNLLTGVYEPTSGRILLDAGGGGAPADIGGKKPWQATAMGLARTFQNIRLFKDMDVLDNVRVAMHARVRYRTPAALFRAPSFYAEEARVRSEALALLDLFGLRGKAGALARNLPYGEQRRLEIVRALATKPRILLLDEPAAGMNQSETAELTALIARVRDEFGLTVLLIEHDMSLVMNICERIYVLDYGELIAEGTPGEVRADRKVIEAYLGDGPALGLGAPGGGAGGAVGHGDDAGPGGGAGGAEGGAGDGRDA